MMANVSAKVLAFALCLASAAPLIASVDSDRPKHTIQVRKSGSVGPESQRHAIRVRTGVRRVASRKAREEQHSFTESKDFEYDIEDNVQAAEVDPIRRARMFTKPEYTEHEAIDLNPSTEASLNFAWAAREWASPRGKSDIDVAVSEGCEAFETTKSVAAKDWFSFQPAVLSSIQKKDYALTKAFAEQAWSDGTLANMKHILMKMQLNRIVRVLVLGGSFTRGHGCVDRPAQDPSKLELGCSWPSRLQSYLRAAFPHKAVEVMNRAEHGTSAKVNLQTFGALIESFVQTDSVPDMVIMDSLVNDAATPSDAVVGAEALIRAFQEVLPKTQLVLVTDGCPECVKNSTLLQTRRSIAEHYRIPTLDYAGLVLAHNKGPHGADRLWPFSSPPLEGPFLKRNSTWPKFLPVTKVYEPVCCPGNHPPWPVHQYMSNALGYGFLHMLAQAACQSNDNTAAALATTTPFHTEAELSAYAACLRPISFHSSKDKFYSSQASAAAVSPDPVVRNGDWKLYEDMKGRPGWIATKEGSSISFPVRFGAQPFLSVAFLRSYAHIGNLTLKVVDASGNVEVEAFLDGHWDQRYSLPHVLNFNAQPGCQDCRATGAKYRTKKGIANLKDGEYNVVFEVASNMEPDYKVKLLSVSTC